MYHIILTTTPKKYGKKRADGGRTESHCNLAIYRKWASETSSTTLITGINIIFGTEKKSATFKNLNQCLCAGNTRNGDGFSTDLFLSVAQSIVIQGNIC